MGHKKKKKKYNTDNFSTDFFFISNLEKMDAIELVEFYKTMKTKYPPFFCFRCGKKLSEEISQELKKYYSDGFVELEGMGKVPISKVCFAYFCESCLKHYNLFGSSS